ncbi:MAG TPA: DNA ligase D [Rhodanobacteraceae bacterium]|nr:DNA ligase D [Rhodanobacteraceae bacterium]
MSLTEYRRKRHFGRTREPEPGKPLPSGSRTIFVVQLHHASHRHYDFRLQVGDALKSWAVPKGPSLDPGVKRLAAEVEDHPVGYADFEGEIPKGEYGGGHVATFDRGVWSTEGDAEEQLAKGHLRFELFGERLKGGWHLVRSRRPSRRPEWLLIKQQDRHAGPIEADDLLEGVTPPPSAKTVAKNARKRKGGTRPRSAKKGAKRPPARRPRGGWAAKAAALTDSKPATLGTEPFAPELARLGNRPPAGDGWLHEVKWDGYRILAAIVDGKAHLWSRNALDWTRKLPDIVAALESLGVRNAALDGELVAMDGPQSDFGLLQATLSGEKQAPLRYVMFDLLHLDGYDIERAPLIERKRLLEQLLKGAPTHLAYSTHVRGNGEAVFAAASRQKLEGIVSKRADAPYRSGRGDDWKKTKHVESDEFAVVGFTAPKGNRAGFGSLLLARPDAGRGWVYAGRVGAGFSDAQLRDLKKRLDQDTQSTPTVHVAATDTDLRRARWTAPKLVVEVFFRGFGNQGLLRQPSLKGVRSDKSAGDLADPDRGDTTTSVRKPKMPRKPGTKSAGEPVRITHPERIVYADCGVTKQQVADYYRSVLDWFLPEIAGRPLSIVRCPDGADRACFFQKHRTAGLERVDSVRLKEETGNQADYLVVNDADGLMELVQFNALEFHPWGARADAPDRCDRIVFDIDPAPDVPWKSITAAARKVRDLLEHLSLTSFLRTSGGKGLHVVVPLKPACDWDVVRPFARAFAETLAASQPDKFVAVASKRLRTGRIFLDYLRNGRGATSVASYSLRARAGAPVAVPLAWPELARLKRADAFDIFAVPKRLARLKKDPWEGIGKVKQDLKKVGAMLSGS